MKRYTTEELKKIIENHQHWLKEDCDNWEHMRANLSYIDLSNADLRGANLRGADLYYANLSNANLSNANLNNANLTNANLNNANLYNANLSNANLNNANLSNANLSNANLNNANLTNANLYNADLSNADLRGANLRGADLHRANLSYADLHYANLNNANLNNANLNNAKNIPFIPYTCPDTGSFIGYKKAGGCIVELKILSDARRCSATGRKCRCDKAKVLSIQYLDNDIPCDNKAVASGYDSNFIYRVGEIVEEPNFDENRWNECSKGIHFFINRQEAVEY